jgi:hypothetical protein
MALQNYGATQPKRCMGFLLTITSQPLLKRFRNANCKIVAAARRRHITAYAIT